MPVNGSGETRSRAGLWGLAVGSIGVVYGDIGTSPLYALREAVIAASGPGPDELTRATVLGVVSLILWALFIIVTLKYVVILLRADNNGEGGTLTLMALASRAVGRMSRAAGFVALLGIVSAALFYGDAVITPALSVLSAVEGIDVATPAFHEYVVPLTVVILIALFAVQSRGTAKVAALFGPIMLIWFVGDRHSRARYWIAADPGVLWALNPYYGVLFPRCITAWSACSRSARCSSPSPAPRRFMPTSAISAAVRSRWPGSPSCCRRWRSTIWARARWSIAHPKAIENPFFLMYPGLGADPDGGPGDGGDRDCQPGRHYRGLFADQPGDPARALPRFEVRHTSAQQAGQIYMPRVNGLLLIGVLLLVALFRSSSALASAYGIAVTGTMVVTCMMAFIVIWRMWRWSPLAAAALMVPFLLIDLTFLSANMLKVVQGGWVPLALGGMVMLVMYTWRRGTRILFAKTRRLETPLDDLVRILEKKPPQRVPGTAVFLTSDPNSAPTALMHSLKHYKVLHEKNVILSVETTHTPRVEADKRVRIEPVGSTFTRVLLRFGYMESPNIPRALAIARKLGWQFDIMSTSFFLSRRTLRPAPHSGMPRWQDRLFIALARSANDATDYFQIPTDRVVEVGTQVTV